MFYRTDILNKAGLDPTHLPTTWSEFRTWCETIKSKTAAYPISCPLKGEGNPDRFIAGVIMAGAETNDIFDLRTGRFNISDGPMTNSVKYVQDLYAANLILPGFYDKDVARGYFAAGKAAIYSDGFWLPSVLRSGGLTDDSLYTVGGYITPDPGMEQGRAQLGLTGSNIFVSSKTQHPEAVWEFIQWYTQPDGWFAKNFVGQNFGTLSFADNDSFVTGSVEKRMLEISSADGFRVVPPVPMLKCKDAARSQAYTKATSQKSSWEMDEAAQAVLQNSDFGPVAGQIAQTRQKWFEDALDKEKQQGLNVSLDCYTFPEWVRTQDYDPANYPK
jgi:ABC-type glycerol-3-phosphate transport system substrate-binding protein